jgi:hypothetical protein
MGRLLLGRRDVRSEQVLTLYLELFGLALGALHDAVGGAPRLLILGDWADRAVARLGEARLADALRGSAVGARLRGRCEVRLVAATDLALRGAAEAVRSDRRTASGISD